MNAQMIAKYHYLTLAFATFCVFFTFWTPRGVLAAGAGNAVHPVSAATSSAQPAWREGLRLTGSHKLRFLGFDIYRASLWAPAGFEAGSWERSAIALELAYLRDFRSNDIARRSLQEMRKLATFSDERATRWQEALQDVLPDVRSGDRIVGIHLPGVGARFVVNGRPAGEIADAEFARLFFGIWLSPATSEPQLRQALLAQSGR